MIEVGSIIQFKTAIEDFECYAEGNMRARVTYIKPTYLNDPDPREHVYKLGVDFTEFETFNEKFESFNYYDENGIPRLNARQAGFYQAKDVIYMPGPEYEDWSKYLEVVSE